MILKREYFENFVSYIHVKIICSLK